MNVVLGCFKRKKGPGHKKELSQYNLQLIRLRTDIYFWEPILGKQTIKNLVVSPGVETLKGKTVFEWGGMDGAYLKSRTRANGWKSKEGRQQFNKLTFWELQLSNGVMSYLTYSGSVQVEAAWLPIKHVVYCVTLFKRESQLNDLEVSFLSLKFQECIKWVNAQKALCRNLMCKTLGSPSDPM